MKQELISDKCNAFLDETMNLNDLPGLAIGVSAGLPSADPADNGPAEFIGVRGYRDYATRDPLTEDSIFHCASVSKLFTSSAVMRLVEAGALDLSDRLCELLPDLPIADRRWKDIRLWNMLTHTSGLGDVEDYHWYDCETDEDSLRRYVYENEEVSSQPMLWEPQAAPEPQEAQSKEGSRFRYSNIAYEILGQLVAEYSGRMPDAGGRLSYEDFIARYLLEPAGMSASTMKTFKRPGAPDFTSNEDMALPHEKKPDRSIGPVEHYPYTRQHAPSSTLTSNVRDLLRWGRAHLASARGTSSDSGGGPLLNAETYRTIWRDYATVPNNGEKMGLGWFMREQTVTSDDGAAQTYRLFGHEGTDDGFRASFWICPKLELVTVVLSNLSGAPVKRINKKLFETIV